MDKSILLVLLSLQAFLLIMAFTSTDAAALVTDDQQLTFPGQRAYKCGLRLVGRPSAMDKSVLLVLFCLQAFLLITAFTSTDAANLVTDDQQLTFPGQVRRSTDGPLRDDRQQQQSSIVEITKRGCRMRPGGCGSLVQ
ncbi:uncharacterized protein LOC122993417 isoform X2 [Scomber scombrus]|uniref:Uncharacterized protein LOC122993417 isoform X2 n=1 Tax=Scomber scombrus TaxID=13677 RepID=A0AAV1NDN9_SCOSC